MEFTNTDDANTWLLLHTDKGRAYYYNRALKKTQWELPTEGQVVDLTALAKQAQEQKSAQQQQQRRHSQQNKKKEESNNNNNTAKASPARSPSQGIDARASTHRRRGSIDIESYTDGQAEDDSNADASGGRVRTSSIASRRMPAANNTNNNWTKKGTATFGAGTTGDDIGECYYVNSESGETQWQRPDGYESEEEVDARNMQSTMLFDPTESIDVCFDAIGVLSVEAAEERKTAAETGRLVAVGQVQSRLENLLLLVQQVGTEVDWDELIMADDYALPRAVFESLPANVDYCTYQTRYVACQLFLLLSKLQPSILTNLVSGQWGASTTLVAHVEVGVGESRELTNKKKREESIVAYVQLLAAVLTECQEYGLAAEQLPSERLVKELFDIMAASSEELFFSIATALCALNMHMLPPDIDEGFEVDLRKDKPSMLLKIVAKYPKTEFLGEAVLHLLNQQHFPYDDEVLLKQLLKFMQSLFRYKATSEFMFTNDLMVLTDMMVLELTDLPPEDAMRWEYLRLLQLVIMRSPWAQSGNKYRAKDIHKVLDGIMQAHDATGVEPRVISLVQAVLTDCADLLTS